MSPWIVETLRTIGVDPVAVPEVARGARFFGPDFGAVDIGMVGEPNLELLAQLRLDTIFVDERLNGPALQRLMSPIAPVVMASVYTPDRRPLAAARAALTRFGVILGREEAARQALARSDAGLAAARHALKAHHGRPAVAVRLIDSRNIMLHPRGSLFHDILGEMGMTDASSAANDWGFLTTGIETLSVMPDARILHFEPAPRAASRLFSGPSLWSHLPSVQQGRTTGIPELYAWGGLPTAERFARLLAARLPPA